ncbi:zinc ribbon domain-containing protein [Homoserinibacter sp. YIM 151385]|uniref:zinc ribbon domain-containing protein n=1 Tax=Homoserinibacter sp. YIM 151385 TaxID=2985506 RepID=UPI0022F05B80|nr:hypothetical protein [Homoserinibacter sp. YIM 151385]WBU38464.1 hypothetical protein OF852_02445 [Homoserinibacter sp. YIM 151385]
MPLLKADPADQALLLEVQELDTRLQQLANRAARLPETAALEQLSTRRDELTRTLAERTGEWEDAKAELGRVEGDVAVVEARIARDRRRLEQSSSVKDIQALEQELQALARRRSDLEDIELQVMEVAELREAALEETRVGLRSLEDEVVAARTSRDAALGTIGEDRTAAERDRETIAGRVPAELLALYEKQRARYGLGASHLRGGVTSASGVSLTASDLASVRRAAPDDVILCPDSNAVLIRTAESGL